MRTCTQSMRAVHTALRALSADVLHCTCACGWVSAVFVQWHWYVTRAAPFILGSYLLPFCAAMLDVLRGASTRGCQRLLVLAAIVVGLYSTQAHKEYRFILPAIPLLLIVIAHKLVSATTAARGGGALSERVVWLLLLAQLPPAVYFSGYHMSGGQGIMDALHTELSSNIAAAQPGGASTELSVGFLTACHMTPWQAQLHMDIPVHVRIPIVLTATPQRYLSTETIATALQLSHHPRSGRCASGAVPWH
jgi:hypothetical protein